MKRIAAVAALIVTMLAVPAAAMASTGSSGSGPGHPGPGQFACPPPFLFHHRLHQARIHLRRNFYFRRKGQHRAVRIACAFPLPYRVPAQAPPFCGGTFTFDIASGSSTFTEVSGPTLAAPEEFAYDGNTYTIWTVNPGADSFTASVNGSQYVDDGPSITGGTADLLCSG